MMLQNKKWLFYKKKIRIWKQKQKQTNENEIIYEQKKIKHVKPFGSILMWKFPKMSEMKYFKNLK